MQTWTMLHGRVKCPHLNIFRYLYHLLYYFGSGSEFLRPFWKTQHWLRTYTKLSDFQNKICIPIRKLVIDKVIFIQKQFYSLATVNKFFY